MTEFAIEVSGLCKRYGQLTALNDIELGVYQGEFFGLLGPNGAGKSTLINILAGLVSPTSGSAKVMGADVQVDFRQARRNLGVVPQELVYDPFFSVRESLRFQSGYYGIRRNDAWIDELLDGLGLTDKADTNLRALSGGMKRRVLIGLALVHKPPVVVLDEPTAGVDVELRKSLWRFVNQLNAQGHTVILTTHYLEEAEELCDRIAIINRGEMIALEDKQALLDRGLGRKLIVDTAQPAGTLPSELADRLLKSTDSQLQIRLSAEQDSVIGVVDQLRDCGVSVLDIRVEEDSLENVFVQLTSDTGEPL